MKVGYSSAVVKAVVAVGKQRMNVLFLEGANSASGASGAKFRRDDPAGPKFRFAKRLSSGIRPGLNRAGFAGDLNIER